jgi:hypothetical protein
VTTTPSPTHTLTRVASITASPTPTATLVAVLNPPRGAARLRLLLRPLQRPLLV